MSLRVIYAHFKLFADLPSFLSTHEGYRGVFAYKNPPLSLLNSGDSYEEDLKKRMFLDDLNNISNVLLNISSSLVRIKLHTNNQPPSLLNSGYGYEEDLKIWI